ncbi:hypothetical protein H310_03787 [Aphanomyces invadans]|uniref:Methyltransferase domain-containing protein n=1 Tax=Aphanomyces invadans TaxID=157072 RepID=A0A024UED4_9STRA|nr:hypothetical protein H310_03787 [Aphanomyces invadans]ETW04565.1 hypothetical protein H310_03787 [Aphanomyces invadans]|eukprot:XP_008866003.1 hypothetical protein H310_03787 [Aphanomyces invadans]
MGSEPAATIYPESATLTATCNPYLDFYRSFQKSQPKEMARIFDPDLDDETREELFNAVDDNVAAKYSWAIPDERALRIIKHYGPIVEIGAGTGYWGRLLQLRGVDIKCFDLHVPGDESANGADSDDASDEERDVDDSPRMTWLEVEQGTPEVLTKHKNRTLLLCYPDDYEDSDESMAEACLNYYTGEYVIHIGELFGHTLCLPEPWGRTSSPEFQTRLAAVFHKILQVPLHSWHSSVDTLTVWKRTKTCIVDDGMYAFIPADEQLNMQAGKESAAAMSMIRGKLANKSRWE